MLPPLARVPTLLDMGNWSGMIAVFGETDTPLDSTFVQLGGILSHHYELADVLISYARFDLVAQTRKHSHRPPKERTEIWGRIAIALSRDVLVIEEVPGENDEACSLFPLYCAYPDGYCDFYLDGSVVRQRLALA